MCSAVAPETSGLRYHLPLLREWQGLSHKCHYCFSDLCLLACSGVLLEDLGQGTTTPAGGIHILDAALAAGRTGFGVITA